MSLNKKLNIILLGRKSWSAKALEFLINEGHQVLAVVGNEPNQELDSRRGSLIEVAKKYGVLTPTPTELYDWLYNPSASPINLNYIDLVISYLFWQKIKEPLLSLPNIGAINFHPAPLPDYKGLGGYNAAILDRRSDYGVTAHFMNEKIDEGKIIKKRMFHINKDSETAYSLEMKSQFEMFKLFKEVMENINIKDYLVNGEPNSEKKGIYINRKKFEEMKIIHLTDSFEIIERKIRAFWFPPYEGAKVKVGNNYYTVVNNTILSSIAKVLH